MVKLKGARVKAVKADLLKNEVTLTFTVALDDQVMLAKRDLGIMEFEKQTVDLTVEEQQMKLPFKTTPGSTVGPFTVQAEGKLGGGDEAD